ncbi:molecular chaperone [Marinomonas ostreistagni]|uniref:fimbrial biogenesis chaperone n=1 Tax=Marinomonas ostreistagni TaxID=359209 RepID=UPI001950AA3D|nr:fimbria/pilus periplasmic chaperone [Marinomonas ostreistagni]
MSLNSYADLLISPVRVVLDERDRSASVTLINSGQETRSYRVSWSKKIALPQGGYRDLTPEEDAQYAGLERMVRISPKQVTLAPKQRQTIKLLVRNPGNLAEGEYRSHLTFTALPAQERQQNAPAAFNINVLMNYTMPVLYRKGTVRVAPSIENLSLVTKQELGKTFIKVDLAHQDRYSTSGRLIAYWTPEGGEQRQVALINGYNFYPELRTAQVHLAWPDFALEPGLLEVRYEGQNEFRNYLLARQQLLITNDMIRSLR